MFGDKGNKEPTVAEIMGDSDVSDGDVIDEGGMERGLASV